MQNTEANNIKKAGQISPLTLAFVGDAVYECAVRDYIVGKYGDLPPQQLHVYSSSIVRASAQAQTATFLQHHLTEEEKAMYQRGRNTHSHTVPKNADVNAYRVATGLETLMGFLHLSGQNERLEMVLDLCRQYSWEELIHGKGYVEG
ncbi:Mini-ribonuclease 3 [Eubacteriales bacterium OttesenSCG-928-N14]|nr:Mini-ribonuclease 3 [Eubacteriales bacterium OttesenSCG-928-N14]